MVKTREAKVKQRDKFSPQSEDYSCPVGFGHSPYETEEVVLMKKKRKAKHLIEETGLDQGVTLKSDSGNQIPNSEEVVLKKKKRKAKHLIEETGLDQGVTLKRDSGNLIPDSEVPKGKKRKKSSEDGAKQEDICKVSKDEKPTADCPPAVNSFLSILSNVDFIPYQEEPKIKQNTTTFEKYAAKKRRRVERRLEMRNAKRERNKQKKLDAVLGEGGSKALKTLADCNIANRKLKEKIEELVRFGDDATSGPKRKRLRSITPDREIVSGYKWKDLTDQQKETFNKKREQRRLDKLNAPKVVLIEQANNSSIRLEYEERTPLTLAEIQHFLIYGAHGHHSTGNIPSWISLKHPSNIAKMICVVVDGASLSDYTKYEDQLPVLKSFNFQLEVITPYAYGGDFSTEFWTVPLTRSQRAKLIQKYGQLSKAELKSEAFESLKKIYPSGAFRAQQKFTGNDRKPTANSDKKKLPSANDRFPRTELLLRSWDLLKESVPVPFATGFLAERYKGFVRTKDEYAKVTDDSPIWAVDCEMCETCQGSELTRISVINEDFEVVYESLVKPYNPITNYLTQYSGITPDDLKNEWTRLEDVQQDLRSLLPSDVILAGHSVGNDLLAMKMFHPYVIDTSVCFNLSGIRGRKTKLKTLVAELLYERIQEGGKHGHDSVEDAASCLKLLKTKLAKSIEWGDAVLGGKRSEQESVVAQQQLLLRSKEEKGPTIYPVAANAIIRSGPRAHQTVSRQGNAVQRPFKFKLPVSVGTRPLEKPRDEVVLTKSLVSHLFASGRKNVLVVGSEKFLNDGQQNFDKNLQKALRVDPRLQFTVQEDNKVLSYGCGHAPSNGVSILQLSTPLSTVDEMIGQTVKNFNENVLFMVFLTGKYSEDETSPSDNHGLFMMKIIKPAYTPLTIEDLCQSAS